MRNADILEGNLQVVDPDIETRAGLVIVEGAYSLKYLERHQGRGQTEAAP